MAGCSMISAKMTIAKPSVCNPKLFINRSNRMNFAIPQSGLSFPVSRLQPRNLPPINKNIFTSVSFQCRCTKEEKPGGTINGGDNSGLWTQFVSKLHTAWYTGTCILKVSCKVAYWCVLKLCLALVTGITLTFHIDSNKKEPMNVSLDELVGIDVTVNRIFEEYISILKGTREKKYGSDHLLIYGPLGAGKATLVHALARKAGVSFFPVSALDIAEVGPMLVESIFWEASRRSPSMVFIEDIDVIAQSKSDPNLTMLYSEMEKCNWSKRTVLVVVATNIPEPWRLPSLPLHHFMQMYITTPLEDSRRKIVGLHLKGALKGRKEDKEAICNLVASQTSGLGWADLKYIAHESIRQAFNRGDDYVTMGDVVKVLGEFKLKFDDNKDEPMAQERTQLRPESLTFGTQN